jgi:hypothetical protein
MVDYLKSDLAELAEKQKKFVKNDTKEEEKVKAVVVDDDDSTIEASDEDVDDELEYFAAINTHRAAVV